MMRWLGVLALVAACSSAPTKETHTTLPPSNIQRGYATWYGEAQQTASGERFDKHAMTAAHRTLRLGTRVRVTNQKNGRSVVVRINDRGPYGKASHIIDMSEAAARVLGMIDAGVVPVVVEIVP